MGTDSRTVLAVVALALAGCQATQVQLADDPERSQSTWKRGPSPAVKAMLFPVNLVPNALANALVYAYHGAVSASADINDHGLIGFLNPTESAPPKRCDAACGEFLFSPLAGIIVGPIDAACGYPFWKCFALEHHRDEVFTYAERRW